MEIVSIDFYTAVVPYSLSLFVDAPVCFQIGLSESESSYASLTVCVVVWPLTNVKIWSLCYSWFLLLKKKQ